MEVFSPLTDKGSSPARSITKMHSIIDNHQTFINEILKALLTCNPQNSQFTSQITKIQEDFNKNLEENNLIDNNTKTIKTSFKNFVETTEANISCIKIDIDQLNKQTNENCEVLTTLGANLQSLRDDFELFKMKRPAPASPRKRNDQNEIEKIKSDVESLKNALEVVNDNYVPNEKFENAVNDIKNLNEIAKKMENADYQKQIQELSRSLQDLMQKENIRDQQINKIENAQNTQESKIQQSINQINKIENVQNTQEGQIQQSVNQISKIENAQSVQEGKLQQSIDQISKIEQIQNSQEDKLQQSSKEINEIKSQLEEIKNSMNQTRDIPLPIDISEIQAINKKLDQISNSQAITDRNVNSIGSHLEEQQSKYLYPLMDRINKIESQFKDMKEIQDAQNNIVSELPDFESINQRLNELTSSQNKTIETVNALNSKLEEQQSLNSQPLNELKDLQERIDNIENITQKTNGIDKNEILQIPELSDILSIKELVNEIISSQTKTIKTVNELNSKFNKQNTDFLERVEKIDDQLNELNNLQERMNEIENNYQNNGLDKDEIPEISDMVLMKDLVNEIASSQTKTIETVNALNSKLEEHQTKYSHPLLDRVNKIEDQLNQIENNQELINSNESAPLEDKITNFNLIEDRLNELTASQNKTIETINALNSKLLEQQTKYSHPLLERVGKLEEQLNQIDTNQEEIQNIQTREIKIDDDNNFNELKENVDLLSSKQQEMISDYKSQKSRLNNIIDDYSSLQGQINELSSKLSSIEDDKGKKKFTLPSFSSDDDEEDENDGTTDTKLRKRVSKLEKIVAHLMSAEQLKSKMIPIDFVDEVDMENETTDETLRRHNKEISILAKDFIVLSNEVIDIQGTLNEQKFKEREPKGIKQSSNDDLIENNNNINGNQLNNEDLDTIKTRIEEIASFYSKLHEANKQLIPHIRQHQNDINLLSEKQKSLEDQFEQFEMLHETENYPKPTEKDENEEEDKVTTRQIVVNDSEELSALKLRVNELASAFSIIRDLNNAIIDRMRNVDSDISLLMARQNQIEEQSSMSEHDHEHSGRHIKRVKKHHRRRRQFEEEEEPSQSNNENENNENEPQITDKNINQNTENQSFDAIIERINIISSNNAQLFDVCNALKSHLENQQKEISGVQKISHDIRCIKHELRNILTSRKERNDNDDEDENYEDTKSAKKNEEQNNEQIEAIKVKLNEVINISNDQTLQIEKQNDQMNKYLLAIKSLKIQLKDKDEQIEDLQKELIKQRNEIIDLKENQNMIKDVQERSANLDQPKLPHDLLDTIDSINRRLDELEQNKGVQSRIDDYEKIVKELASQIKIIIDSNNGQKSYLKAQNQTINQMSSEIFERIEEIEFNLSKLDDINYAIKCIKFEVKRLKNAKVSSPQVQNRDEIEAKLQEHEKLLAEIVERMPSIIENSNKHSDIIEKHKLVINQQTAAIKSLIENRTKYNLNDNEEDGTPSYGNNLRQEINQIKRTLNNLSNNPITQRSIPSQLDENDDDYLQRIEKIEDGIQNLERKVQQQEEIINKLSSIPESTENTINDKFVDLINNHINKLESTQQIIIQDQNTQKSNINVNQDKLSRLEVKFDQIEERLDLIERNKGDNEIRLTNENGIVPEKVYNKIAEQSDLIDSLKQQIESIQDSLKSTQNDQEITEINESIQSLKKSIKIIESKLKNNFIKITEAHQTISNRFDKISKDIRLLKESNKSLSKEQDQEIDINIESNKLINRQQEISVNVSEIDQNNADFDQLVSEFSEFKKNQEQLNNQLKKLIDESNQRYTKNQNQNQNPNSQTDLFSLKKEIDTLKINDIRKEINSLKNEQKKILSSLSKSITNQSTSNDEKISVEAITANVNKMKDELIEISSHIQKNDEYLKKELENKSAELNSNADQIEEAKKLANRIVKIVKGHDEKLKKIKDHIDYQNNVLSEITGRDIKMISSRPTTPK